MANAKKIIKRRRIPKLPDGAVGIGKEGQVKRSFDVRSENPIRVFRDEELELSIEFQNGCEDAVVACYTNFNQAAGVWHEIPFEKEPGFVFTFREKAEHCGVFAFRITYSLDNGASWIWDRSPLMYVHVDPPRMRSIRSYTFIPTVTGKVEDWMNHLAHVKEMGFNMMHLLPVTQMGGSESPYSAVDLFALDESFWSDGASGNNTANGLDLFERFVAAAQQENISLCIDLVLNHVNPDSQIAKGVPDWIMPDKAETDGLQRSGCWHMDQWLKWGDLVKIEYDHPNDEKKEAIWQYMTEYALFWAYYADITNGMIRLDNLHNSDEDFIEHVLEKLRDAYPNLIVHAEFFSDSNTLLKRAKQWDLNLFLANPWEYPYAENLRDYIKHCHEIGNRVPQYMPVTTHDTGSPAEMFGSAHSAIPRYFVTALMSTGQTGIVQGVEYAVPKKVGFIGRNQSFPYEIDPVIMERITQINAIHEENPCLHQAGNVTFVDDGHGAVIGAFRGGKKADYHGMLLFANLDTTNPHVLTMDLEEITGSTSHELHDLMHPFDPQLLKTTFEITLPPCGVAAYRLFSDQISIIPPPIKPAI